MNARWNSLTAAADRFAPAGSTKRKLLQLFALLMILEGSATIILSSYFGFAAGAFSVALGVFLLLLLPPRLESSPRVRRLSDKEAKPDTIGVKAIDILTNAVGGDYVVLSLGVVVIILDVVYNSYYSSRPDYGDLDTLAIMFGGLLVVYPFIKSRFRVETAFALWFLGLVVLFLVMPQAVYSLSEGSGGSSWYTHYMLAAPFAGILDLIGIPASSSQELVTITFRDGSIHTLGISAACAGLYSFSIFVSAFISFVLVFERLRIRLLIAVLGLGLLAAYLGNLFRMVVIGVVGYYNGMEALLWAHKNVGWIVFLSWSAVFWYLVMRYADKRSRAQLSPQDA